MAPTSRPQVSRNTLWKLLGLAGIAGVAITGAAISRNERQRRAYTPDEVRAKLHARLAEAEQSPE